MSEATSQKLEMWRKMYGPQSVTAAKLHIFMSVVITTVIYACEIWIKTASLTNLQCLRSIFRIS